MQQTQWSEPSGTHENSCSQCKQSEAVWRTRAAETNANGQSQAVRARTVAANANNVRDSLADETFCNKREWSEPPGAPKNRRNKHKWTGPARAPEGCYSQRKPSEATWCTRTVATDTNGQSQVARARTVAANANGQRRLRAQELLLSTRRSEPSGARENCRIQCKQSEATWCERTSDPTQWSEPSVAHADICSKCKARDICRARLLQQTQMVRAKWCTRETSQPMQTVRDNLAHETAATNANGQSQAARTRTVAANANSQRQLGA